MPQTKKQNGAQSKATAKGKNTMYADTRTHYLGVPTTEWDLENMRYIEDQVHACILHEHGVVHRFGATLEGWARPTVKGEPVGQKTHVEAALALSNFKPTGKHLETDDGMEDEYVWLRRGENGKLQIIRSSKVRPGDYVGYEAFAIKHYPEYFEREETVPNDDQSETASMPSHEVEPSKSKNTGRKRARVAAEETEESTSANLAPHADQSNESSKKRAAEDDADEPPNKKTKRPAMPPSGVFTNVRPWPRTLEESRRNAANYISAEQQLKVDERAMRLEIILQLRAGARGPRVIYPRCHPEETEEDALARISEAGGNTIKIPVSTTTAGDSIIESISKIAEGTKELISGTKVSVAPTCPIPPFVPPFRVPTESRMTDLLLEQLALQSRPEAETKQLATSNSHAAPPPSQLLDKKRALRNTNGDKINGEGRSEEPALNGTEAEVAPAQPARRSTRQMAQGGTTAGSRGRVDGGSEKFLPNGAEEEAVLARLGRRSRQRGPKDDTTAGTKKKGGVNESLRADTEEDAAALFSEPEKKRRFSLKLKKYNPTPAASTTPATTIPAAPQPSTTASATPQPSAAAPALAAAQTAPTTTDDAFLTSWSTEEKRLLFKSYIRTADVGEARKALSIFLWHGNQATEREGRARAALKSTAECDRMIRLLMDRGWVTRDE